MPTKKDKKDKKKKESQVAAPAAKAPKNSNRKTPAQPTTRKTRNSAKNTEGEGAAKQGEGSGGDHNARRITGGSSGSGEGKETAQAAGAAQPTPDRPNSPAPNSPRPNSPMEEQTPQTTTSPPSPKSPTSGQEPQTTTRSEDPKTPDPTDVVDHAAKASHSVVLVDLDKGKNTERGDSAGKDDEPVGPDDPGSDNSDEEDGEDLEPKDREGDMDYEDEEPEGGSEPEEEETVEGGKRKRGGQSVGKAAKKQKQEGEEKKRGRPPKKPVVFDPQLHLDAVPGYKAKCRALLSYGLLFVALENAQAYLRKKGPTIVTQEFNTRDIIPKHKHDLAGRMSVGGEFLPASHEETNFLDIFVDDDTHIDIEALAQTYDVALPIIIWLCDEDGITISIGNGNHRYRIAQEKSASIIKKYLEILEKLTKKDLSKRTRANLELRKEEEWKKLQRCGFWGVRVWSRQRIETLEPHEKAAVYHDITVNHVPSGKEDSEPVALTNIVTRFWLAVKERGDSGAKGFLAAETSKSHLNRGLRRSLDNLIRLDKPLRDVILFLKWFSFFRKDVDLSPKLFDSWGETISAVMVSLIENDLRRIAYLTMPNVEYVRMRTDDGLELPPEDEPNPDTIDNTRKKIQSDFYEWRKLWVTPEGFPRPDGPSDLVASYYLRWMKDGYALKLSQSVNLCGILSEGEWADRYTDYFYYLTERWEGEKAKFEAEPEATPEAIAIYNTFALRLEFMTRTELFNIVELGPRLNTHMPLLSKSFLLDLAKSLMEHSIPIKLDAYAINPGCHIVAGSNNTLGFRV